MRIRLSTSTFGMHFFKTCTVNYSIHVQLVCARGDIFKFHMQLQFGDWGKVCSGRLTCTVFKIATIWKV